MKTYKEALKIWAQNKYNYKTIDEVSLHIEKDYSQPDYGGCACSSNYPAIIEVMIGVGDKFKEYKTFNVYPEDLETIIQEIYETGIE